MAKVGREVEGVRNYGLLTLFLDASEVVEGLENVVNFLDKNVLIDQVYICDHDAILDWKYVDSVLGAMNVTVTIETRLINQPLPTMLNIMLNITDGTEFKYLDSLRSDDEVKIAHGLNVLSWSMGNTVRTYPHEFNEDVEVSIE